MIPKLYSPTYKEYLFLFITAIVSFGFYGLPFYDAINSDIAVHVYMTEHFKLSENLYFWGQDRLGSIVPLIGRIIYVSSPLSAIWACAISEYLFLILGCVVFLRFIPNSFVRYLTCLLWFFPARELIFFILPAHPYSEQLALLGLSFLAYHQLIFHQKISHTFLFVIAAILSIWISDFSLLYIGLLPLIFLKQTLSFFQSLFHKENRIHLFHAFFWLENGYLFLLFAKTHTSKDKTYIEKMFSYSEEIRNTIDHLIYYFNQAITFRSPDSENSFSVYFTLISTLIFIFFLFRKKLALSSWNSYFLLSAIVSFIALLFVRWVSINGVMLKYFIPCIYMLFIALFSIDYSLLKAPFKQLQYILFSLIIVSLASSQLTRIEDSPADFSFSQMKSFEQYKNKAFIGDYWYSYILGISDPEHIAATPYYDLIARSKRQVNLVMSHDTIYVVKNNWLQSFPDSIELFQHHLFRIGDSTTVETVEFAPYKKLD